MHFSISLSLSLFFMTQGIPRQPLDLWPLAQGLPDSNKQGLIPRRYIHGCTHSTMVTQEVGLELETLGCKPKALTKLPTALAAIPWVLFMLLPLGLVRSKFLVDRNHLRISPRLLKVHLKRPCYASLALKINQTGNLSTW